MLRGRRHTVLSTPGGVGCSRSEYRYAVAAQSHIFTGTQMSKKTDLPAAPRHLSADTADWWRSIVADYDLEPADLRVLEAACVNWDRSAAARESIAKSEFGILAKDRFGQWREHPSVAIEQNATRLFLAALRQLGLGMEPSSEPYRLPNPTGPRSREDD